MDNHTNKQLEMSQMPNLDEIDVFEMFKRLYLEWVRFFRQNMSCNWECPAACPLPDDCLEIERVWLLWLETLTADDRVIVN